METSHIKNCIKAIKEWRIMQDYIDWTYWSTAEEVDAWYVDRSEDRKAILNAFEKELNRRELAELKEEIVKLKTELSKLKYIENKTKENENIIKKFSNLCNDLNKDEIIKTFEDGECEWEHWYVVRWYIYKWKNYDIDLYSF